MYCSNCGRTSCYCYCRGCGSPWMSCQASFGRPPMFTKQNTVNDERPQDRAGGV